MQTRLSRRSFLQAGAASVLTAASWSRVYGANEKLRLASVGTGGKGWEDLTQVAKSPHVSVFAICDVDESMPHLGRAAERYPHAVRFTDWRKLLDRSKEFDALTVSTPDHMHAPVSLPAMQLGKHVHCQKPLTHCVFEARQMRLAAKKYGVVTQMGNQIQSHETYRTAVKLVHDGAIGKVKEVHSWQAGRLGWLLVDDRPPGMDPIPESLHWDDWLGVAKNRPYKARIYHSFNWRAWQDFSNGQIGDFGCHILDPVFMGLGLTAPLSVSAESSPMNREVWYKWSVVHYVFPGTDRTAGKTLPLTWYDGDGKLPPRDELGLPAGFRLPGAGSILIGAERLAADPARRDAAIVAGKTIRGLQDRKSPVGRSLRRLGGCMPRRRQDDVALRLLGPIDRNGAARHRGHARTRRDAKMGRGQDGGRRIRRRRPPFCARNTARAGSHTGSRKDISSASRRGVSPTWIGPGYTSDRRGLAPAIPLQCSIALTSSPRRAYASTLALNTEPAMISSNQLAPLVILISFAVPAPAIDLVKAGKPVATIVSDIKPAGKPAARDGRSNSRPTPAKD